MIDRQEIDKRYIYIFLVGREKKQNSITYIEHSFLSIDRKIFVKYRTLPFFLEFLISKAAYHKHPTPYD